MTNLVRNLGAALRRYRRTSIWASGFLSAALVIFAAFSPLSPVERLNFMVFDGYQSVKPRHAAGSPITVVDIDDASIGELGQWPWPRTALARIIGNMTDMGAALLLPQSTLTGEGLADTALALLGDPDQLMTMENAARAFARPGAASDIATGLEALAA